ncbi:MAG TPA: MFS transporter [Candidatus Baltobacteraceae bacterium]|nr:MFS transporter [Candidatus Baltobacteraceae bacterium]
MERSLVALLCTAHFITDVNQGALPALLPFLISEYHLSYEAAGLIIFSATVVSTIVQPVFGHLADRISSPWLMPAGVFLAGLGMAATGWVPGYNWILLSVMISGVGVAAFHPQGAQMVARASGDRQGSAMSIFGVGGTVGFAVGPLMVTAALLSWGLKGSAILAVPVTVMAAVLAWRLFVRATVGSQASSNSKMSEQIPDAWGPFSRLTGAVICRAVLFFGFNTFVPLYWINVLHGSKTSGALALSVFSLSSIGGNLVGGRLSDRWGHTRVAVAGFCAMIPLVPLLMMAQTRAVGLILLALIGFCMSATYSPLIVLGQQYLPNHTGLSAGVTLGVAITIGGVAAPVLGRVADDYGLWAAFAALSCTPVLAAALAFTLPRPRGMAAHIA